MGLLVVLPCWHIRGDTSVIHQVGSWDALLWFHIWKDKGFLQSHQPSVLDRASYVDGDIMWSNLREMSPQLLLLELVARLGQLVKHLFRAMPFSKFKEWFSSYILTVQIKEEIAPLSHAPCMFLKPLLFILSKFDPSSLQVQITG